MRFTLAFAALLSTSCGAAASELPLQAPEQVVDVLTSALRACSAPLTAGGSMDQAAPQRAGWRIVRRTVSGENGQEELPTGSAPAPNDHRPGTVTWMRDGLPNNLHLTRYGAPGGSLHDECAIDARVRNRGEVDRVVAAMTSQFGRRHDRAGEQPRGGDFLTPRFDTARYAYHWALPMHDVYLSRSDDRFLRLVVLAMADRGALDRFSPDRPEARIPIPEGSE